MTETKAPIPLKIARDVRDVQRDIQRMREMQSTIDTLERQCQRLLHERNDAQKEVLHLQRRLHHALDASREAEARLAGVREALTREVP